MWPETIRVIRLVRPKYALLENVPGLLSSGYFGRVLGDLAESGYDAKWCVLGADDVGAPHRRKRAWIYAWNTESDTGDPIREIRQGANALTGRICQNVAHSPQRQNDGRERRDMDGKTGGGKGIDPAADFGCQDVANTNQEGLPVIQGCGPDAWFNGNGTTDGSSWWDSEPAVGRVADGVAHRVDRLAAIGNGQVPAVVRLAWETLKDA